MWIWNASFEKLDFIVIMVSWSNSMWVALVVVYPIDLSMGVDSYLQKVVLLLRKMLIRHVVALKVGLRGKWQRVGVGPMEMHVDHVFGVILE